MAQDVHSQNKTALLPLRKVLVDLLHLYQQIGVDMFARLREFNKARWPHVSVQETGA